MRARIALLTAAVLLAGCGAEYPDAGSGTTGTASEGTSTSGSGSSGASSGSSGGDSGSMGGSGSGSSTGSSGSGSSTGSYGTDTWSNFAQPFFEAHCTQCHGGEWSSYANVSSQRTSVRQALASGAMPRGTTLSADDRAEIVAWFDCGLPE